MNYQFVVRILRRFPTLYAGMRGAFNHRIISRPPVQTPLGFKMAGLPTMEQGKFEPDETNQVSALLKGSDVFIDVGANTGYYVCLARKMGVKVVAIEPLDQNVQILQRNVLANGWNDIEIYPVGIGDSIALLKLYGGGTAASLVAGWAGASNNYYRIVPVTKLDNILGDRFAGQRVLILIDVEGYELNVLRGAVKQLMSAPPPVWFIEICINEHQPDGTIINPNLMETFDIFWRNGYSAERVGCESGIVSEADVRMWTKGEELPQTHNFLFRSP